MEDYFNKIRKVISENDYFNEIREVINNEYISHSEQDNLLRDIFFRIKKEIKEDIKSKLKKEFDVLLNDI